MRPMNPPSSSPFGPAADTADTAAAAVSVSAGGAAKDALITFGELEQVDLTPPAREMTWAELQARRVAQNDGVHAWFVPVYFQMADPEVSMDDMVCGPDNMIGIGPMLCFWCRTEYPRDGTGRAVAVTYCPGMPADA